MSIFAKTFDSRNKLKNLTFREVLLWKKNDKYITLDAMQTILIELKSKKAFEELHKLEEKNFIRIVNEDFFSYSLPGKPISEEEFRAWVEFAEKTQTMSLNEAKQRWEAQKKKLQNLIR